MTSTTTSPKSPKTLKELVTTWDNEVLIEYRQTIEEIIEIAIIEHEDYDGRPATEYEQHELAIITAELAKRGLA